MAKPKTVKDVPTVSVRVERGRLVPSTQYDLELLGRWREGATLNIEPVEATIRALEKQYFAQLSDLLREADTGWECVQEAHRWLKKKGGFVEPYKRKNGEWTSRERHISSLSDHELTELFQLLRSVALNKFDIDPDTLWKPETPQSSSEEAAPSSSAADPDDGPGADPIPVGVGEPLASAPNPAEVEPEAGGGDTLVPRTPSSADGLSQADVAWLKQGARMLVSATEPGGGQSGAGIIDRQARAIKQTLTGSDIGPEAKRRLTMIYRHCTAACIDNAPFDKLWIADTALCKVDDLRPEAR